MSYDIEPPKDKKPFWQSLLSMILTAGFEILKGRFGGSNRRHKR